MSALGLQLPEELVSAHPVSEERPWPGLSPFTEQGSAFFHGRSRDTEGLARVVRRAPFTVLYGQSGLGKSSLLMAGLFPLMWREDFLPVYVRLVHEPGGPSLGEQLFYWLMLECERRRVSAPVPEPGASLWSYLHRTDLKFWGPKHRLYTPLFVIDQFEELFTLGARVPSVQQRKMTELAELVDNRPPAGLMAALPSGKTLPDVYDLEARRYKLVLAMREDHLASLDELKRHMRVGMHTRAMVRLDPMGVEQALEAVQTTGGGLVEDEAAGKIVDALARGQSESGVDGTRALRQGEVDPALLSMMCFELNEKRLERGDARIEADLLKELEPRKILANFYHRSFDGLLDEAPRLRWFVEERLITEAGGLRESRSLDEAGRTEGVTLAALGELVKRRLLRADQRAGVQRVELAHDVLTEVVKENRDKRRVEEEERRQRDTIVAREREAREQAIKARLQAEEERKRAEVERQRAEVAKRLEEEARANEAKARESEARARDSEAKAVGSQRRARIGALIALALAVVAFFAFLSASRAQAHARQAQRQADSLAKQAIASADQARASDSTTQTLNGALQDTVKKLQKAQADLGVQRREATLQQELGAQYLGMSGDIVRLSLAQREAFERNVKVMYDSAAVVLDTVTRARRDLDDLRRANTDLQRSNDELKRGTAALKDSLDLFGKFWQTVERTVCEADADDHDVQRLRRQMRDFKPSPVRALDCDELRRNESRRTSP